MTRIAYFPRFVSAIARTAPVKLCLLLAISLALASLAPVASAAKKAEKSKPVADLTAEHKDSKDEIWWTYVASYNDVPGAIRLNMKLKEKAPVYDFGQLVITGASYVSKRKDTLAEDSDAARLDALRDKVYVAITKVTPAIYTGSFTNNGQQRYYFYVKDPSKLEQVLADVYAQECPKCKTYTSIRKDLVWDTYRHFMYPNPAARKFYKDQLLKLGIPAD